MQRRQDLQQRWHGNAAEKRKEKFADTFPRQFFGRPALLNNVCISASNICVLWNLTIHLENTSPFIFSLSMQLQKGLILMS